MVDSLDAASASIPFVGRVDELDELGAWWEHVVVDDAPGIVVVSGEPGVGKTRLAHEFTRGLASAGVTVLTGAATETRFLPYEPWVKALRGLFDSGSAALRERAVEGHAGELAGIPWLHDLVDGSEPVAAGVPDESAVTAAVVGVLSRLTTVGPVAVMVDDVHWADNESVRLLEHVVTASIDRLGIVVVERRPTTVRRAWAAVDLAHIRCTTVTVDRFDRRACAELVRTMTASPVPDEFVDAVHDASGGNAFVVESLLELTRLSNVWGGGFQIDLPQTAAAIWADRFAALPADVLDVLALASVVGTTFEESTLVGAMPVAGVVTDVLQTARSFALIEPVDADGGLWRFTHALLREYLYDRLTATRRRRLHRAVATTLERTVGLETSDRSAQIAYHWRESGPSGAWPTLRHTTNAARWAFLQGSPDTTRLLGRRAVELVDTVSADAESPAAPMRARFELGDVLLRVGDEAGVGLMEAAVSYYEPRHDVDALARIADALLRAGKSLGQSDAGSSLAERLVNRLDGVDPRLHSRVLARLARVMEGRVGADDFIASISETALRLARAAGDPETLAIALYCCNTSEPWSDDRLERGRELVVLGDLHQNVEYSLLGRHMVCTQLLDRGDVDQAGAVLDELCELAERAPRGYAGVIRNADLSRVAELTALNQRAIRAQLLGDFAEQERLVSELWQFTVDSAVERDRVYSVAVAQSGILAFDRGELEDYVEFAVEFADAQPETTQRQVVAAFILAWVGRTDEARRFYAPIVDADLGTVTIEQSMAFMLILLAWTTQLLGDAEGALQVERRLAPFSGRSSCYFGGCLGPTDFGLGLAALAYGDHHRAVERFTAALDQADRWGAVPIGARIRLKRAEVAAEHGGDLARAAVDVDEALAAAASLGMREVVDRARRLQRELALRRSP